MLDKNSFIDKTCPEPNTGCWIWMGRTNRNGYGEIRINKKIIGAHRYSYLLFSGPLKKFHVLHKCDTPSCVNPAHLLLGTNQDNINDKMKKGRSGINGGSKRVLNKIQIMEIQELLKGHSSYHIAPIYGVSSATIRRIRKLPIDLIKY